MRIIFIKKVLDIFLLLWYNINNNITKRRITMNLNSFRGLYQKTAEGQRYEQQIKQRFAQYNCFKVTENTAKAKKKPVSYIIG